MAMGMSLPPAEAANVLVNGEFTGSVTGWTNEGATVFNTGDSAVFSDSVASASGLFQSVAILADTVRFEIVFDLRNLLSNSIPPGQLPDVFFGSLYLGTTPFGASLNSATFDQYYNLFDLDSNGFDNLPEGAAIGSSPKGPEWVRYSLNLATTPAFSTPGFATLSFEFFEQNGINSDSVAVVDNVSFIPVVIPESSALAFFPLFALLLRRRREPD